MLDTLSNIKSRLGITGTEYDTFLTEQGELISDVIEAYCRRKFAQANYTQTFYREDYRVSKMMEMYHFPVSAVSSITFDGDTVDSSEYRLHSPTGRIVSTSLRFFSAEVTVVSYTAGYSSIPRPILAVLDALILERYNKKVAGVDLNFGSDVQRISIPGAISIDFDYTLANNERKSSYGTIIGNYANVLDDWRSERSVIGSSKLEYMG